MKYKAIMKNVGRNKAFEEKTFDHEPEYADLLGMVRRHLLSSLIDFESEDIGYPYHGIVIVGGWRPVGKFTIEKMEDDVL